MLTSYSGVVYANLTTNKESLPDFLENLLVSSLPKASPAELDLIRTIWINQLKLNEEHIADIKDPSGTKSGSYMSQLLDTEIYGTGATIYNPSYIVGSSYDYNFARFYTPNTSSGASVVGQMSSSTAHGSVLIAAKLGPTGDGQNGNYFTVFGNDDPDPDDPDWWDNFIGYAEVTYPYEDYGSSNVYIGYTSNEYPYVAVGCTTSMGGNCTYNDIMADRIWFSQS